MAVINILSQDTVNKIAAGEVIERPGSVIKELVENAIDAKATAVTVEIKDGGISYIRITDNGSGIERSQIEKAFLSHATSKIESANDLFGVNSLGFRGEALSSIAAIAKVEVISKTRGDLLGIDYIIEGGKEISKSDIGAVDGTTVIVRDLFFNTPVRRDFLKSASKEASYISEITERLALSHPNISFRLIVSGQTKLYTTGNGNIKDLIYSVFGRDIASNLTEVAQFESKERGSEKNKNNLITGIKGYICKPIIARGNRTFENYFINGRFVKSNIIMSAIEDAYKPYMMLHRYPFTALYITMDTTKTDVNVHPKKMEVRFSNDMKVYDIIYNTLKNTLENREYIPKAGLIDERKEVKEGKKSSDNTGEKKPPEPFEINIKKAVTGQNTVLATNNIKAEENNQNKTFIREKETNYQNKALFDKNIKEKKVFSENAGNRGFLTDNHENGVVFSENAKQQDLSDIFEKFSGDLSLKQRKYIGQVFSTYLLAEYKDNLYIIDQHAAHEKILYEQMIKQLKTDRMSTQRISPPIIVTLTDSQAETLKQYKKMFKEVGYDISSFGGKEYQISGMPANLYGMGTAKTLISVLDDLSSIKHITEHDIILEKIASMACRAAVKGNSAMSEIEAKKLIEQLSQLENPYMCPHGRPVIISLSKSELEKKFKRVL